MVRVDALMHWPGKGRWCHMFSDSDDLDELHAMARKIGLRRGWFQPHKSLPHYDLRPSKRTLAIENGAEEATRRQVGAASQLHRKNKVEP